METKTIKVSKKNYQWLCQEAGKLQEKEKRNVSIDETLSKMHERMTVKFSDLAGLWEMNEEEADKILMEIRKGWKNWTIESV